MFQIRLKNLREERNMSQQKLASEFGLSQSAIGMWESGKREPDFETMKALAQFFNVSVDYLVGNVNDPFFVLDNRRILNDINSTNTGAETPSPAPRRINVYGRIPAGVPLEAITDIIDWEDIPGDWSGSYIALQVQGDSMNPEYREGDVIIVRVQPDCESGQDCVVYVNGYDATLKRVVKQQTCIMLQPLNPTYEPKIYEYTDPEGVTILGVVVEMRRKKG